MEGLTVGRNVHYVTDTGKHLLALVVYVHDKSAGMVNLTVFNDWGYDHGDVPCWRQTSVPYNEEGIHPDTWHFIERA